MVQLGDFHGNKFDFTRAGSEVIQPRCVPVLELLHGQRGGDASNFPAHAITHDKADFIGPDG